MAERHLVLSIISCAGSGSCAAPLAQPAATCAAAAAPGAMLVPREAEQTGKGVLCHVLIETSFSSAAGAVGVCSEQPLPSMAELQGE